MYVTECVTKSVIVRTPPLFPSAIYVVGLYQAVPTEKPKKFNKKFILLFLFTFFKYQLKKK